MTARSLWLRLASGWLLAAVLLAVAAPAAPVGSWRPPPAIVLGAIVGTALFLSLGGRGPRPAALRPATAAVLVLAAGAEEVVWRWFALGELAARAGALPALAATTVLFALAHRPSAAQQLVTGAAFGLVYLGTGALAGAWCAHAAYNLLVASTRSGASP